MKIKLTVTYMHTALGDPPQYRVLRLTLVYSHVYTWSMVVIPLMNFILPLPLPLPLDQFLNFTEASPQLSGDPFVSSLLPSLRILEKTCDPSLSVTTILKQINFKEKGKEAQIK